VDVKAGRGPAPRLIAKFVLLVAVLLMPFGMAHATPSTGTPMSHCPNQPSGNHGKAGFAECAMVCSAALPAADWAVEELPTILSAPPAPVLAQALDGILLETSTPPPKFS
jgi:hypothetical protein